MRQVADYMLHACNLPCNVAKSRNVFNYFQFFNTQLFIASQVAKRVIRRGIASEICLATALEAFRCKMQDKIALCKGAVRRYNCHATCHVKKFRRTEIKGSFLN